MACVEFCVIGQISLPHWKTRNLAIQAFKKIPDTSTKTGWNRAWFQKGQPTPAKLRILFPAHLWVREFWPQIFSLSQALDWGLLSKILASTKWVGPRIPRGQLSRVPWSGNLWMPFTFQPALQVLQQPHKQSHSLQLATDTELEGV